MARMLKNFNVQSEAGHSQYPILFKLSEIFYVYEPHQLQTKVCKNWK